MHGGRQLRKPAGGTAWMGSAVSCVEWHQFGGRAAGTGTMASAQVRRLQRQSPTAADSAAKALHHSTQAMRRQTRLCTPAYCKRARGFKGRGLRGRVYVGLYTVGLQIMAARLGVRTAIDGNELASSWLSSVHTQTTPAAHARTHGHAHSLLRAGFCTGFHSRMIAPAPSHLRGCARHRSVAPQRACHP
jgi:hypothetical protein